jgi:hypothetical protein
VLFGTYHSAGENVGSGTCKLGNVNSGASEGAFSGSLSVSISPSASVASLTTQVKAAAGAKLVPGTTKRFIYADSTCQCYHTDPGMTSTSTIEYLSPVAQTASGHCYGSNIMAFHMATLQNQNSGTFSVELVGTNAVLAPIGGKAPCSTLEGKKNVINLDVSFLAAASLRTALLPHSLVSTAQRTHPPTPPLARRSRTAAAAAPRPRATTAR